MLSNLKLWGIDNVKKVFLRGGAKKTVWDDEKGFYMTGDWVLETNGTNLTNVLAVEYIDPTRTISNDIVKVIQVLEIKGVQREHFKQITESNFV